MFFENFAIQPKYFRRDNIAGSHGMCFGKWTTFKGQLISKGLFGFLNFPKKRTKKFDFTKVLSFYEHSLRDPHFTQNYDQFQYKSKKSQVMQVHTMKNGHSFE